MAPLAARPSLAGAVTDDKRRTVGSAHVCAVLSTLDPQETRITRCAETDKDGHYEIGGLRGGAYTVTASAPGFAMAAARDGAAIDVPEGTFVHDVNIVVSAGGSTLAGVVLDATGGPVSRASVRVERFVAPRAIIEVTTDDLGRFAVAAPEGRLALLAQADGYAAGRWTGVAPSADVRVLLTPGATVRGVVVSGADGRPVSDLEVRVVPYHHRLSPLGRSTVSGAEGQFDVRGLDPGEYAVVASGNGFSGELGVPVRLGLAATVEHLRLVVGPATAVVGHVLLAEADGPCDRGMVRLGSPDLLQATAEEWPAGAPPPSSGPDQIANIGADGAARFSAVPPGHYFVTVQCTGHTLREGPRVLDVGAQPLSPTWKVGPALRVALQVVDERDQPVARAQFSMRVTTQGRSVVYQDQVDDQGRYDVSGDLYPGTCEIEASPPFSSQPVQLELHDGDGTVPVRLKVDGSAAIVATVLADGAPADGLTVSASLVGGASPGAGYQASPLGDGRYRIAPLKPGRYAVRVDDGLNPSALAGEYTLRSADSVEVKASIDRSGRIRGRVVDDQGTGVPDVWVVALASSSSPAAVAAGNPLSASGGSPGGRGRVLTEADGRFVLDSLRAGETEYALRVEHPGGAAVTKTGVRVSDAEVTVTFPAPGSISGHIAGACPDPAQAVILQVYSAESGTRPQQLADRNGSFVVEGVQSGHVELSAFCPTGELAQTTVDLQPRQSVTGINLVLQAPLAQRPGDPPASQAAP
jgi:hypothetical protein